VHAYNAISIAKIYSEYKLTTNFKAVLPFPEQFIQNYKGTKVMIICMADIT
jgi:hypothetical protein